jgi:hypothetical protein
VLKGGVSTGGLVSSKEAGNRAVEEVRWGGPVWIEGYVMRLESF